MKSLYLPLIAVLLVCEARADLKIPAGVFRVARLEEAVKLAREQHKPLAVLTSEEASRTLVDISEDSLKALSEFAVVLYVDATKGSTVEIDQLSPPFAAEIGESLSLPKIVIGPPSEDEVWETISSREMGGGKHRKAIRQAAAKVKAKSTPYFAAKTAVPPVKPGDKMLAWGMANGKGHYKGIFVRADGDRVYMSDGDGKEGAVPFEDLQPASVRYAKFLGEAGAEGDDEEEKEKKPAAAEKPAPGPVERWTNKEGKDLQASFVSLVDGKLTLRSAAGKEYTIALETLSLTSQIHAKERAAPPVKKINP